MTNENKTTGHSVQVRAKNNTLFLLGMISVVFWLLLFAVGLLVETVDERLMLAPRSVSKQLGLEGSKTLSSEAKVNYKEFLPTAEAALASDQNNRVEVNATNTPKRHDFWDRAIAFGICFICFTPTNIALLTLCAGLAGGCASNISITYLRKKDRLALKDQNPERYFYLREPPVTAALRGFVVFLCVIAGLYIAIEDPFRDPTPAQYLRLAGLLSILAFLVGYDPTRLEDWLRLVPSPGRGQENSKQSNYEEDESFKKSFAKQFELHFRQFTLIDKKSIPSDQSPNSDKTDQLGNLVPPAMKVTVG